MNTQKKSSVILTSAALSLLLTGCGSGSSTDEAVTKSVDQSSAIQTKAPIEASSVLSDVVATMLAQSATRYTVLGNVAERDTSAAFAGEPWTQSSAGGRSLAGQVSTPPILLRQLMKSPTLAASENGQTSWVYEMATDSFSRATNIHFNKLTTVLNNTIITKGNYPERTSAMRVFRDRADGEELLSVGETLRADVERMRRGVSQDTQSTEMKAGSAYSIHKSQRIPLNRTLQYWQGVNGSMAQLILMRGNSSSEVRLCLNVHATELKRLTCTQWEIPAGWKTGDMLKYKGLAVSDDRSVLQGESGHLHWQTSPSAPVFNPVRSNGITGQLLANMLTTQTVVYMHGPRGFPMYGGYAASQLDGPMPGASWITAGSTETDKLNAYQQPVLNQLYTWSWHSQLASIPALGTNLSLRYPTDDQTAILLTTNATGRLSGNYPRSDQDVVPLRAPSSRAIRNDEVLPFNQTLHLWGTEGGQHIKLIVLRDASRNDIRLCQDSHVRTVKRLVCSVWQVPPTWMGSTGLRYRGIYVVDDHNGVHTFWQTRDDSN